MGEELVMEEGLVMEGLVMEEDLVNRERMSVVSERAHGYLYSQFRTAYIVTTFFWNTDTR